MMAGTGTYEKLYLIGGLPKGGWSDALDRPFTTTDGETYKYVFTAEVTNDCYFRVTTGSQQYRPQNDGDDVETTYKDAYPGSDNKAWKLTMTKGKSYTLIFDYKNKQIKYSEGGSEVVTKVIKLLNGSTEVTGSNGKYTLDLSSATSDATITLNIGGADYGLTTAKTIDAVGTTSDIAFTTEGTKALTLKAGLVYSITVTDEGKMTVVASVDTTKNNPLPKRTYTQGYYLAGNFFTFSGDKVTYDDAVFKFQQQGNDDEGNAVYMVEIPASLTAHAQVMSVDEFGKPQKVYGPVNSTVTGFGISCTCPETGLTKEGQLALAGSDPETFDEGTNYWNIRSRNETADKYSDGMYKVYITVDGKGKPTKWQFKHIGDKRVAFFISDAKNATAMPLYDAYKYNEGKNEFSNRFYASVNLSTEYSYYVISNYVVNWEHIGPTSSQYHTLKPAEGNAVSSPTTNKLFLLGNGGVFDTADDHNEFSPNEKPMKPSLNQQGSYVVEYNPSKKGQLQNIDKYLGIRGEVILRDGFQIKSVSMVGDAIPGTLKVDETTGKEVWDFTSKAADMIYDDVEQCYTTTIVTTAGDGEKHFRFVGNHKKNINWYEDTDGAEPDKMAKTPLTDHDAKGHTADANDPNQVNYTQGNENSEDKYHIIWNRPKGRWTVRLYFYTYNVAGEPVTDYYYTISPCKDLELRDCVNIVYKSEDNKRVIQNVYPYKFLRTWSDSQAWMVSKDIDIFVVDALTPDKDKNAVTIHLIQLNSKDKSGKYNVIPADIGVILGTTKEAKDIEGGAVFHERTSLTSLNTIVVPMLAYNASEDETAEPKVTSKLEKLIQAQVVPTFKTDEATGKVTYNYLFGAAKGKSVGIDCENDNDFFMGFWISNGKGNFYSNSCYLPIDKETADILKVGTQNNQFYTDPDTGNAAKMVPGVIFDFANVGGTTGINEVVNQSTKLNDGKYYTLSGQQVEKPTAGGIYIHNGRKFVVK